jgi:hypothetical protein
MKIKAIPSFERRGKVPEESVIAIQYYRERK